MPVWNIPNTKETPMPDLKITKKAALDALRMETGYAIDRINREADRLAQELEARDSINSTANPHVERADAAAVLDFAMPASATGLTLQLNGGYGGNVALCTPVPPGRYRALILLTKLPDK